MQLIYCSRSHLPKLTHHSELELSNSSEFLLVSSSHDFIIIEFSLIVLYLNIILIWLMTKKMECYSSTTMLSSSVRDFQILFHRLVIEEHSRKEVKGIKYKVGFYQSKVGICKNLQDFFVQKFCFTFWYSNVDGKEWVWKG